jgi:hypothetical protein
MIFVARKKYLDPVEKSKRGELSPGKMMGAFLSMKFTIPNEIKFTIT